MLKDFINNFVKAEIKVLHLRRSYLKILPRIYLSYGLSLGFALMILYLAGNKYYIPATLPILAGFIFIYGCAMLGFSFRLLNKIGQAESVKFDHWSSICEYSYLNK